MRTVLTGAATLLSLAASLGAAATQPPSSPERFVAFDREMTAYMQKVGMPGGAVAVAKDGRLLYAQGYGLADRDRQIAVQPDDLFRIASISKPFTAVAVMQLVERRKLRLDQHAFDLLRLPAYVPPGKTADPRLASITIEELLRHTGGWDRDRSYDPITRHRAMAEALGVPSPVSPTEMIRYMLGQPLDFDPGTSYAYSNFGFVVLGRVVEKVSGLKYEEYVKRNVLAPLGITDMRVGATLKSGPGEVHYYCATPETVASIFDSAPGRVPPPYGGFCLESMDAHGGWLASAQDLVRFAMGFDHPERSGLLKPETVQQMFSAPPPPVSRDQDGKLAPVWYGLGWQVRQVGPDRINTWHNGLLQGTYSLLVRRWDGWSWAAVFNQCAFDGKPYGDIDPALHRAADATRL